jgi:hypothetical protein
VVKEFKEFDRYDFPPVVIAVLTLMAKSAARHS